MVKALDEAVKVWTSPDEMIQQWDESESKEEQDRMMARMVGTAKCVADLGCGAGHLLPRLHYVEEYHGFDFSPKLLEIAIDRYSQDYPFAKFFQCDVFAEASSDLYDVVVLYDVAVHQDHPVAAVRQILKTWNAKRYLCTLLVGPQHKQLYATVVVSFEEFERLLCDKLKQGWTLCYHWHTLDSGFDWVVLDINR